MLVAGQTQKERYLQKFMGKTLTVAPENCIDGYTEGYAENYIRVYIEGETEKSLTQVRVERPFKEGVLAKIIKN